MATFWTILRENQASFYSIIWSHWFIGARIHKFYLFKITKQSFKEFRANLSSKRHTVHANVKNGPFLYFVFSIQLTVNICSIQLLPMTGFKLLSEVTALPTEPQPLPEFTLKLFCYPKPFLSKSNRGFFKYGQQLKIVLEVDARCNELKFVLFGRNLSRRHKFILRH